MLSGLLDVESHLIGLSVYGKFDVFLEKLELWAFSKYYPFMSSHSHLVEIGTHLIYAFDENIYFGIGVRHLMYGERKNEIVHNRHLELGSNLLISFGVGLKY